MDERANPDRRLDDGSETAALEGVQPDIDGERLSVLDLPAPDGAECELDRKEPAPESPELESVIGVDSRRPVPNSAEAPFNRLCQLAITTARGVRKVGTGWVIGHRMVVTAGHCVYRHEEGDWVKQIVLSFGKNGGSFLDRVTVTRTTHNPFDVPSRFRSADFGADSTAALDYGSILLPRPVNSRVKRMGFSSNYSDDRLARGLFNVFGYPVDKGGTTLWGDAGRLTKVRSRILSYAIDTFGGQSGAPVIHVTRDSQGILRYIAVGIHNSNSPGANLAARVTPDVFETLRAWKSESVS